MTRRMAPATTCLLALAALGGGCGGPPAPDLPPGAPPGYEALRETFGPADFGPLQGRIVVLDPGHGGHFRGALGPNGLTEAEVNLGVALHLRGLLEWAGAGVHLTRTADRDFLTPADSTLAGDLAFRVSFTDSIQPDVFLSIHHNSNASYDPTINETQTYHPLGADGASLDLARAIHRHLVKNLEIAPARILPGNFRVLRDATVPAVLGEPAMISHPGVADLLSRAAKQRLEAEAYFLGLLEYFAAGDPGWQALQPDTLTVGPAGSDLKWVFAPERRPGAGAEGSPAGDPASFSLELDGRTVAHRRSLDGGTVQWTAPPQAGGVAAELVLRGSNLAGRAAPVQRTWLRPAAATVLQMTVTLDGPGTDGSLALVSWLTPTGAPPPAGRITWPGGATVAAHPHGVPEALLSADDLSGAPAFLAADSTAVSIEIATAALPAGWQWTAVAGPPPAEPWRARLVNDQPPSPPAGRVAIPRRDGGTALWTAAGRKALARGPAGDGSRTDPPVTIALAPSLERLTFVIDPAGGGADADRTGPGGLRGAEVNLGTARQLVRLLQGLGATAVLTRDGSAVLGGTAKISLAERVEADFFLTIGRSAHPDTARLFHHPGSRMGQPWAAATDSALSLLWTAGVRTTVGPSWAYLLRHTSCPALEVHLPHATTMSDGLRLAGPAWQAAEARALLRGIVGAVTPDLLKHYESAVLDRLTARNGGDPGRTWGTIDGQLPWYPLAPVGPGPGEALVSWGEPGLPLGGDGHVLEYHDGHGWSMGRLQRSGSAWDYVEIRKRPARRR
ncbi:MAG: hypothetical protein GY838_08595 [bacterium]|nr:hypothetical protein [bacterium]